MKFKIFFSVVLFHLFCLFTSCDSYNHERAIEGRLNQLDPSFMQYRALITIPNEGCGGCISGATFFAKDNENKLIQHGVRVIFTGIQDNKLFRNTVGSDFLESELVYIDKKNVLMDPDIASIYPQLMTIKNGKIIEVVNFDSSLSTTELESKLSF